MDTSDSSVRPGTNVRHITVQTSAHPCVSDHGLQPTALTTENQPTTSRSWIPVPQSGELIPSNTNMKPKETGTGPLLHLTPPYNSKTYKLSLHHNKVWRKHLNLCIQVTSLSSPPHKLIKTKDTPLEASTRQPSRTPSTMSTQPLRICPFHTTSMGLKTTNHEEKFLQILRLKPPLKRQSQKWSTQLGPDRHNFLLHHPTEIVPQTPSGPEQIPAGSENTHRVPVTPQSGMLLKSADNIDCHIHTYTHMHTG